MLRIAKLVSLLLVLGFGIWSCKYIVSGWEHSSTDAHSAARAAFRAALPESDCVTLEEIKDVAEEWSWAAREEPEFGWCVAPPDVQRWLRVTVEPPLPFSTEDENAVFFAFDGEGCSVPWRYGSGAGTSCP